MWAIRARLDRLPAAVLQAPRIVVFADDPWVARLAAVDLAELAAAEIATVPGGSRSWQASGVPLVASPKGSRDAERVDYLFWNHDRQPRRDAGFCAGRPSFRRRSRPTVRPASTSARADGVARLGAVAATYLEAVSG
ncbi:MAG: hypothetical protein WA417_14565 [Stellaceae bacterium]